jgi:hypothetical protein
MCTSFAGGAPLCGRSDSAAYRSCAAQCSGQRDGRQRPSTADAVAAAFLGCSRSSVTGQSSSCEPVSCRHSSRRCRQRWRGPRSRRRTGRLRRCSGRDRRPGVDVEPSARGEAAADRPAEGAAARARPGARVGGGEAGSGVRVDRHMITPARGEPHFGRRGHRRARGPCRSPK